MSTASQSIKTQGTKLYVSQATHAAPTSPIDYVQCADVRSISGPGGESTEIDTTHLDSAAKEYLVGLKDEGSITVGLGFVKTGTGGLTGQAELRESRDNQEIRDFKISLSDGTLLTFAGGVRSFSLNTQPDSSVEATCTIRVTGSVTIA